MGRNHLKFFLIGAKAGDLIIILTRQNRTGGIAEPTTRRDTAGRLAQNAPLQGAQIVQPCGRQPPFRLGRAAPGAAAATGGVHQHQVKRRQVWQGFPLRIGARVKVFGL